MRYRIGEFAALSGVSVKTLRFYDQIGLLQPATVDPRTRYRQYMPQQLQELACIRAPQDLGASLQDIRRIACDCPSHLWIVTSFLAEPAALAVVPEQRASHSDTGEL